MKLFSAFACAALLASGSAEAAIKSDAITIGVLTDMSGFASDSTGAGSVAAAELAVEDVGGKVNGIPVKVIVADHQNKADIGAATARRWVEEGKVDAVVDVPFSSVALSVNEAVRNAPHTAFLASGPGTADLTGEKCSPNTVHWTYDTWALANGTAKAVVQKGGDSWFFVTADYAFGQALERDAAATVIASGGKVVGSVRHPPSTQDFSSYLLQAQASNAKIVGLANAVGDTINSVKQAAEFGLTQHQTLAALLMQLTDVNAVGLPAAQGLYLTEPFYWDLNDKTRAFAKRFGAKREGRMPTGNQAGVYSSVLQYLKAMAAADTEEVGPILARMRAAPMEDPLFGTTTLRIDGRAVHDMYLFQVKTPAASKAPWDYYQLIQTIPAAEAFRPLNQGHCPLAS
ncbi:MAG TPA: ABC transporter substrate-binding protein [Aliidongia sp.]|uniref:ABC transporter substrate-binding protein n=1 Tax=Aliidongia sp. TaxID=1914230 RepID=UPI002DDD9F21|nr:ABC transporter substrate-binding protein [Aliidongia sp.]HEV2676032.1 ABC transporter substrate-binding protein [Aliidongia sp.]